MRGLSLACSLASKQETILFGGLPAERQRYMQAYGCAAWTEEALELCAQHAPLVEVGAGAGHWQRALSRYVPQAVRQAQPAAGGEEGVGAAAGGGGGGRGGVDIVAFDDGSDVPLAFRAYKIGEVKPGGVEVVGTPECAGRALLLVYPPQGEMAGACLRHYRGDTLIYVGEARYVHIFFFFCATSTYC
ncbi:hypothetical protein T492DRAFT_41531 [Pavlovales sp. CCMP2436]|nr:hypothetical protein T492DRAFT_41531 [Pavlovales sp. CCMP2436]